MERQKKLKCELYNDSMQGWKCYPIQKAQLIIADVPYNVGTNFYGSNPMWYEKGDNKRKNTAGTDTKKAEKEPRTRKGERGRRL